MSRFHAYINNAIAFLKDYEGQVPLAVHLKQAFAREKKFGSRDRKMLSNLCYQYFRLGRWQNKMPLEERLAFAIILLPSPEKGLLEVLPSQVSSMADLPWNQRSQQAGIDAASIVDTGVALSEGIEATSWGSSLLQQPDLFIRCRPGYMVKVVDALDKASIQYNVTYPNCIALPNGTKVEDILRLHQWVVVQDESSQCTGIQLMQWLENDNTNIENIWDCCAGSGGKSIMLHDLLPNSAITVSDIRSSIIANLRKRFELSGIKNTISFTADIAEGVDGSMIRKFDLVLADAPCTGSGTWARTPEQLFYFNPAQVESYARRQLKILQNASDAVRKGGYLCYITCSVFHAENEGVVSRFMSNGDFEVLGIQLINGTARKADSMFMALFRRSKD